MKAEKLWINVKLAIRYNISQARSLSSMGNICLALASYIVLKGSFVNEYSGLDLRTTPNVNLTFIKY